MKKKIIFLFLSSFWCSAQKSKLDSLDYTSFILNATTIINTESTNGDLGQGSGFFYAKYTNKNDISVWLISNRHVLLPNNVYPKTITYNARKFINGKYQLVPFTINELECRKRLRVSPDPNIDVAAFEITKDYQNYFSSDSIQLEDLSVFTKESCTYTKDNFPEVGDDVLIVGYPRGYYDQVNTFPIVKSGVISSWYGKDFNGAPIFLIDSKLFPGSSGSLVISKPQKLFFEGGNLKFSDIKTSNLIGIFSGEFTQDRKLETENFDIKIKDSYNLGIVWYPKLIEEIIK